MQKNGFTLVELAIALMVIGLLIGGVLKGKELIENAKITATVRQFKSYDAAAMMFVDIYAELPGDITKPQRIPNCDTDLCIIPGNGNGIIGRNDTDPIFIEGSNFFVHLTKAGLIHGPEGGTSAQHTAVVSTRPPNDNNLFYPEVPIGYTWRIFNYIEVFFTTKHWAALDEKMDDGHPNKGILRPKEVPLLDTDGDGIEDTYDVNNSSSDFLGGWLWMESISTPPAPYAH